MKLSEGYMAHCSILSTFYRLENFQNKEVGKIVKKRRGNQLANVLEK